MGRSAIILMIGLALIIIPEQSSKLIDLLKNRPRFGGSYDEYGGHNIIISSDAGSVQGFLEEFYHPDHMNNSQTVILGIKPSPDTYKLTRRREYSTRVKYFEGSATSTADLKRVKLEKASNCFILPPSVISDVEQSEKELMLTCLAVENFKKKARAKSSKIFKSFVQLSHPDTARQAEAAGVDVIITAEVFKMSLIAKSCLMPGFSTLIFNLITSLQYDENQESGWYKDYSYSASHEIYKVQLSQFGGTPFYDVVTTIFKRYKVCLFAIDNPHSMTILNPGRDYIVSTTDEGFVIASDSKTIESILKGKTIISSRSQVVPLSSLSSSPSKHGLKRSGLVKRDGNHKVLSQLVQEYYKQDAEALLRDVLKFYNETHSTNKYQLIERPTTKDTENDLKVEESSDVEKIFIREGYYSLMENASIDKVTIQGTVNFENHIIVCGGIATIKYFLLELRKESVKTQCPVVIVGTHPPSEELWSEISLYPSVYFLKVFS